MKKRKTAHLIHGPNLNLLGQREPQLYGNDTLASIDARITSQARSLGIELHCFQSNHEGELVERIQLAANDEYCLGLIINPAAYTHTSVAIRDALTNCRFPIIEIHISNIHSREDFRRRSLVSDIASGVICGFGSYGYDLALLGIWELSKR